MKKSDELNTTELPYAEGLYLLKIVYAKIIEVLDTVCSQNVLVRNEELNFYYVNFVQLTNAVLDSKGFEELKKEAPRIYETIIGDLSDADIEWEELMSKECYEFYGKIEKEYIHAGAVIYELPEILTDKLNKTDELIQGHKATATQVFNNMLSRADKLRQEREKKANEKKKLNHVPAVFYDPASGVLSVDDVEVELTKTAFRTKMLALIMKNEKNMKREWGYGEVIYEIEGIDDISTLKNPQDKFYSACDGISNRIAKKTGLTDLLYYGKITVRLNPKYIPSKKVS